MVLAHTAKQARWQEAETPKTRTRVLDISVQAAPLPDLEECLHVTNMVRSVKEGCY